jgi:hypothetical protein
MDDLTYSFRLSLFTKEVSYRLTERALIWNEAGVDGALDFGDVRQIRVYESPGIRSMPAFSRCVVAPRRGRARVLSSNHFAGIGDFEVRMGRYRPFVAALLKRVAAVNPATTFVAGMPMGLWIGYLVALAALAIITPLGIVWVAWMTLRGGQTSSGFMASLLVCIGFLFGIVPMWRLVRRNRPHRFDPRSDDRVLPERV